MEAGLEPKWPASVGPQLKSGAGRRSKDQEGELCEWKKITPHQRPKAATPGGVAQNQETTEDQRIQSKPEENRTSEGTVRRHWGTES